MIFAQVDPWVLFIGLQRVSILLINITHSVHLIRVKPVGMVAQAHIDSNTCGSHGSSEQQYMCLGDRSACRGCFGLYFPFYVSCFVGGYFMYAIFAAAVFLTCSQQYIAYVFQQHQQIIYHLTLSSTLPCQSLRELS